jgi:hypothetical protein
MSGAGEFSRAVLEVTEKTDFKNEATKPTEKTEGSLTGRLAALRAV